MRLTVWTGHPDVADGEGEKHWGGMSRANVGDVSADVPVVGVDGFEVCAARGPVVKGLMSGKGAAINLISFPGCKDTGATV
jgi:hypothetical protein